MRTETKNINTKFTNGQIIKFKTEGELDSLMLPNTARRAHILPNIKHSLVSIGALCDASYTVTFKIKEVTVIYKYNIILLGCRYHHNKCWYFSLSAKIEDEQARSVVIETVDKLIQQIKNIKNKNY